MLNAAGRNESVGFTQRNGDTISPTDSMEAVADGIGQADEMAGDGTAGQQSDRGYPFHQYRLLPFPSTVTTRQRD